MDKATVLGLLIGFGGILLGNALEGGHISSLMQLTAFVIVLTGTIGAVVVSNREKDLKLGMKLFKQAFSNENHHVEDKIRQIVNYSRLVRKENLLALEPKLNQISDEFIKSNLRNIVDGLDLSLVREIAESEIDAEEDELSAGAKIWMDAGGFSPTIGIIGAVLGLIHVMGNLSDTSKLGGGIAVAFVATVYGVSFANLLFLPMGNKIKKKIQEHIHMKRLLLEGLMLIRTELSPIIIEQKMKSLAKELSHELSTKKKAHG